MQSVVGIFSSFNDARRASAILRSLGIPDNRISVLAPGSSEGEVKAHIVTTEAEQPGIGRALGGTVGGALGVASGLSAAVAVASVLVPGVGPVFVLGLIGAALLGTGGAAAGAAVGESMEQALSDGLPRDELFVYEDALRKGRSVVVAVAEDDAIADSARSELVHAGAESIDAARDEWWIGLRGAEEEHYTTLGGQFSREEAVYRQGFEAALHPLRRDKNLDEVKSSLIENYGGNSATSAFRAGYERGRAYQAKLRESYRA